MSLRKYLLISILLIISTLGGVTTWSSYHESQHEVEELFDAQLARSARMILGLALTELHQQGIEEFQKQLLDNRLELDAYDHAHEYKTSDEDEMEEAFEYGHYYELKLAFQVWDQQGNMILRSAQAPLEPLSNLKSGYSDQLINGQQWRVFKLWDKQRAYLAMVAERYDVRQELVQKIAFQLLLPFVLLLPILAWLLWVAVGRGLSPLKRVADEVQTRDEYYLELMARDQVPEEVKPLVDALNRLFSKLKSSLDKERRFTSDAAHELRTPLAALKIHAQLALSADKSADKDHALMQLLRGVDRASHVVDQLLALARLEPGAEQMKSSSKTVDLHRVCIDIVIELSAMADEKSISLSVDETAAVNLIADEAGLSMLVRNLVDNAIRYTPEGGEVVVALKDIEERVELQVMDSGPGIQEDERDTVFERFYRGQDQQGTGCGIGLSIVKQIADMHHARIEMLPCRRLGGLQVNVIFAKS